MKNTGSVILMVIMAVMLISPVDAIPDVAPVIGWLDDLIYILVIFGQIGKLRSDRAIEAE